MVKDRAWNGLVFRKKGRRLNILLCPKSLHTHYHYHTFFLLLLKMLMPTGCHG